MKFIFWQNVISIHQSSFLQNLAKDCEVILVVEKEQSEVRKLQGWHCPILQGVEIIVAPNIEKINEILNKNLTSWHFFSGIYANKMVKTALMLASKKNMKISIITESYNSDEILGFMRKCKNLWYSLKLRNKVKLFLPIGEQALKQYSGIGYNKEKMFEWAYFTDTDFALNHENDNQSKLPNIIFVGQLISRKNISNLVSLLIKYRTAYNSFKIIGSGVLCSELEVAVAPFDNIYICGNKSNTEVQQEISKADFLILPSVFDGWGAVVNEALLVGTPALVSSNCGAATLLKDKLRGEIFNINDSSFEEVISRWILKGKIEKEQRYQILEWSRCNITGKSASDYFKKIIAFTDKVNTQKPIAPWK